MTNKTKYDKIMEKMLKRAFFYPSSEIYGGFSGLYDYGSTGTRIKLKWEDYWRKHFLGLGDSFYEIQPANIMPEPVFEASGHLKEFVDPLVQCSKCGYYERADTILEDQLKQTFEGITPEELDQLIKKNKITCPKCKGRLKEVTVLNLMFNFDVGIFHSVTKGYLRPETAQGAYVCFRREYKANRERMPLGLAVIGKAYRNEISPRQGLFRMREFTQAELQIFFDPDKINEHPRFEEVKDKKLRIVPANERDKGEQLLSCQELVEKGYPKFAVHYMARVQEFYESLKVPLEKFRFYEKNEQERAFYNLLHFDVEVFLDSFGKYTELAGFHYRGDHDLKGHQKVSGEDMSVVKEGKRFIPHVLELSFGVDRNVFALFDIGYKEEGKRQWFSLPAFVSPWTAGIYPLVKRDGLDKKAKEIKNLLLREGIDVFYDERGSVGKRYARADEIGVAYGITIDYDTMQDDTVTIRFRDSTEQERVNVAELAERIKKLQGM